MTILHCTNLSSKRKKLEEKFRKWRDSFPGQFPVAFDPEAIYLPPFVQHQQEHSYRDVRNGLKFLEEVALPSSNDDKFSLSERATWGYIRFLQCLSRTMEFEEQYRKGGGFKSPCSTE